MQRTAIYISEYSRIAEDRNILWSTSELQRKAEYYGVQRHCRGQEHIAEYSNSGEDSGIEKDREFTESSTARGQDILKIALRRPMHFAEARELQRTAVF